MKALLLPLLAAGALSCRASTVILSGVLHDAEQGIVGGYGAGQGTFSMQLEGSTLTFHVTTSGHPDLLLAAPSLRLALSGGEHPCYLRAVPPQRGQRLNVGRDENSPHSLAHVQCIFMHVQLLT